VLHSGSRETKEIMIIGEDDAIFAKGKSDVIFVASAEQRCVGCGRYVDLAAAQAVSNGVRDLLV
jgi:hypothetical protein